jgi:hypothetical protein
MMNERDVRGEGPKSLALGRVGGGVLADVQS